MNSETTKHLIILGVIVLVVVVVYEIFSTIKAGEASIGKILAAPFTGLANFWKSITGFFSGSGASDSGSLVGPDSPLYGLTLPGGQPINTLGPNLLPIAPITSGPFIWDQPAQ
jgi:hypothetical protein